MTTSVDWAAVEDRKRERRLQRVRADLQRADEALLDTPGAQPILARVGAAIDPDFPDRIEHAKHVTLVVLAALERPRHPVHPKFTTAARGSVLGESAAGGRRSEV